MALFETATGSRIEVRLPDVEWDELRAAVEQYRAHTRERRAVAARIDVLEREKDAAIRKDLEALAQALRDSKPDPGAKAEEKVKKELEAARRHFEALNLMLDDAEERLLEVVDEHKDDWIEEVQSELAEHRAAYEQAIETLRTTRAVVASKHSLVRWLTNFPDQASFRDVVPPVRRLESPNGDPYLWDEVIAALHNDANPQPQREIVVPWGHGSIGATGEEQA